MKLYYIDLLKNNVIDIFYPKIPNLVMSEENISQPRICLSSTLNGCLGSATWGGSNFHYISPNTIFRIYEFDSDDILKDNLITPLEIFNNKWVIDSKLNKEYWVINQNLKPKKIYYLSIEDFDYNEVYVKFKGDEDTLDYYTQIKILKRKRILEKDLLFGNHFKINIKDLLKSDNFEVFEDLSYQVFQDYLSGFNSIKLFRVTQDFIEIVTEESEGLWLKNYINQLKENLFN